MRLKRPGGGEVIGWGDEKFLRPAANLLGRSISIRGREKGKRSKGDKTHVIVEEMHSLAAPDLRADLAEAAEEFWNPLSLVELAESRGIKPLGKLEEILGEWPGDLNDGFEEWVMEQRKSHTPRKRA
jgi:hypothetical protein